MSSFTGADQFYYWVENRHKAIQRETERQKLDTKVKEAFDVSKERDGSRRIQKELAESGDNHNVKTVAASMKRQDLVAKAARKFKVQRTVSIKCPLLRTCSLKILTQRLRIKNGQETSLMLPQAKAGST